MSCFYVAEQQEPRKHLQPTTHTPLFLRGSIKCVALDKALVRLSRRLWLWARFIYIILCQSWLAFSPSSLLSPNPPACLSVGDWNLNSSLSTRPPPYLAKHAVQCRADTSNLAIKSKTKDDWIYFFRLLGWVLEKKKTATASCSAQESDMLLWLVGLERPQAKLSILFGNMDRWDDINNRSVPPWLTWYRAKQSRPLVPIPAWSDHSSSSFATQQLTSSWVVGGRKAPKRSVADKLHYIAFYNNNNNNNNNNCYKNRDRKQVVSSLFGSFPPIEIFHETQYFTNIHDELPFFSPSSRLISFIIILFRICNKKDTTSFVSSFVA